MTTLERVIQIVGKAAGLAPDEPVGSDTGLVGSGLSLDSVAVLELLVALENEFEIELGEDELSKSHALATVGSLAALVESKLDGDR